MLRITYIAVCEFIMSLGPLFGQGMTLVGSGYSDPTIIQVAPGQITTFFVSGLQAIPSAPLTASVLPLPVTLAGISVTIAPETTGLAYPAPLLAVRQINSCGNGNAPPPAPSASPDCLITAITVQVPFELSPVPNGGYGFPADLVVSASGNVSSGFKVYPVIDDIHVVDTCDPFPAIPFGASCGPAVTHADGTLVTPDAPGKPGEVVVIYAFGLGQTTPAVKTGAASPTPASTSGTGNPVVEFDFRPNASPSRPFDGGVGGGGMGADIPAVLFVGLTPGQVGLYQINVRIPNTIPTIPECGGSTPNVFSGLVQSNLTINIGSANSFDGAPICVQSGQ